MKKIMITCQEATYFTSLDEEHKLGIIKRLKWKLHLSMCKPCKIFVAQSKLIGSHYHEDHEIIVNEQLIETALKKIEEK